MDANKEASTEIVSIDLPLDTWGTLALQAHDVDMTLNDYLTVVIMTAVVETKDIKLSPDTWLKYASEYKGVIMMDPDGWDRSNFDISWAEEITRDVMKHRMNYSTSLQQH